MSRQATTSSVIVAPWNRADANAIALNCQISPVANASTQTFTR